MKLKKNNTAELIEKLLVEKDDVADSSDSIKDIAQDLQDQATTKDGETVLTNKEAEIMASDAKASAEKLGGADIIVDTPAVTKQKRVDDDLGIKNKLTQFLDDNLEDALINLELGNGTDSNNVLIIGLPGSGKTASFFDWAKHANPKVNVTSVNAKNNDLEAFINGYTVRVAGDENDKVGSVSQAYGNNLSGLDRPNSILFLDEFNRQTKDQIRASLLTLINEHKIMGKGEEGHRYFPNLLFTVACCNPVADTDKGAGRLNNAETTRFGVEFAYDSTTEETEEYLKTSYLKKARLLDKNSPNYKKNLIILLRTLDLGIELVSDPKFNYDTKNDLDAVDELRNRDYAGREGQLLNQRLISNGLVKCKGDTAKFVYWLDNFTNILDRDRDMIHNILGYYEMPDDDELIKKWMPEIVEENPELVASEEKTDETRADLDAEDDADLFTGELADDAEADLNGTSTASIGAGNVQAKDKIKDIISKW